MQLKFPQGVAAFTMQDGTVLIANADGLVQMPDGMDWQTDFSGAALEELLAAGFEEAKSTRAQT